MAETREKLIELLKNTEIAVINGHVAKAEVCFVSHVFESMADNLIANGVTIPVRCKGCKHWHEETGWCNKHSHFIEAEGEACHPWESSDWKMLNADDFCSYGERRIER